VPIVIQARTLGTWVTQTARAGLRIEALIDGAFSERVDDVYQDPARWYSVGRARLIPPTFIIKARKPDEGSSADR
jgi:hypothetical protein